MTFDEAIAQCGIIAILRGVRPDEILAVAGTLADAGIRVIEVPLNSPEPFRSIEMLAKKFGDTLVTGAGTVLEPEDVERLSQAGGRLCVSPDCNPAVIERAAALGLIPLPGVFTPSEAFQAIRAGSRNLKLFPAEAASPATLKAWRAVLPKDVRLFPVGGVTPTSMEPWSAAGAAGFGIGSNIYKPGMSLAEIETAAKAFVVGWQSLKRS